MSFKDECRLITIAEQAIKSSDFLTCLDYMLFLADAELIASKLNISEELAAKLKDVTERGKLETYLKNVLVM